MSIAVLNQVYDETRRLAIAGSAVAPGDFRLRKLVEPLSKAGEKAPVFAKVGQAVAKVVDGTEKNSAEALLELSTLVNAILYTQGETGIEGKLEPIETINLGPQETQASARMLKPLLEALTTTGSGRLEIIRDAYERGAFHDMRLVKPALQALDDSYAEIGDFVADNVLPLYGKAILPELRAKLDIKGRGGHVRRLTLMHQLDPQGSRETVKKALEEGSKEIKVAAIACLGEAEEDLSFLLEQSKAAAKDVREAAYQALAKSNDPAAVAVLHSALQKNDLPFVVAPVRASRNPQLLALLLGEAQDQLQKLLAGKEKDKKKLGAQVERMLNLLECLRGRDDKQTEAFLLQCFEQQTALAVGVKADPGGMDIVNRLVSVMATGPQAARKLLIDKHEQLAGDQLGYAFAAARRTLKPADVFANFSPYLVPASDSKRKARDSAAAKSEALITQIVHPWHWRYRDDPAAYDHSDPDEFRQNKDLDPRWLDVAVETGNLPLVLQLARPGHKQTNAFLLEQFSKLGKKSSDSYEAIQIVQTMVRVQHPAATETLIALLLKNKTTYGSWLSYTLGSLIPQLPRESLPQIEAVLPQLPEKAVDQLLEHVQALKAKT